MNNSMTQLIHIEREQRSKKRQTRLIVSYLMQVLRIPDGDHLILFFGDGDERSNRDALMTWVEKHMDEIDPDETEQRLSKLAAKASRTIEEQQWSA